MSIEEQKERAARYQALLARIKETEPRESTLVTVEPKFPRPRDRWHSYKDVTGPEAEAYAHAAWLISKDTCTPMYEHMLMRPHEVSEHEDGTVTIRLVKSHYAGD